MTNSIMRQMGYLLILNIVFCIFATGLAFVNESTVKSVVIPLMNGAKASNEKANIPMLFWISCALLGAILLYLNYGIFGLLHRRAKDSGGGNKESVMATTTEYVATAELSKVVVFTSGSLVLTSVPQHFQTDEAKFYLVKQYGKPAGPFSAVRLRQMLDYCEVSIEDAVISEDWPESIMIGLVSEIMTANLHSHSRSNEKRETDST